MAEGQQGNKRRKTGKNGDRFWKPGQPLTQDDEAKLEQVRRAYRKLGYSPSKKEVPSAGKLKERFRTWPDVLRAAGLPRYNDPDQMRARMKVKDWERSLKELMERSGDGGREGPAGDGEK